MIKYRLKPEARPFFDPILMTKILSIQEWEEKNVSLYALEKLGKAFIEPGIPTSPASRRIRAHHFDTGISEYHFTVNVFSDGKDHSSENYKRILDAVQNAVNELFDSWPS